MRGAAGIHRRVFLRCGAVTSRDAKRGSPRFYGFFPCVRWEVRYNRANQAFERSGVMAYRTPPLLSPAALVSIIILISGYSLINNAVNPSSTPQEQPARVTSSTSAPESTPTPATPSAETQRSEQSSAAGENAESRSSASESTQSGANANFTQSQTESTSSASSGESASGGASGSTSSSSSSASAQDHPE